MNTATLLHDLEERGVRFEAEDGRLRYHAPAGVLTPKIIEKLEQTQRGAGGEIQMTDAIMALMAEQDVYAYAFDGRYHDAGTTMGWLKASVELALERHRRRAGLLFSRE